jgi:hypothetical protein
MKMNTVTMSLTYTVDADDEENAINAAQKELQKELFGHDSDRPNASDFLILDVSPVQVQENGAVIF